jgi:hypothetical protein
MKNFYTSLVTLAIGSQLMLPALMAGDRRFSYVYEATTSAKGEIEIENFVTWKTKRSGHEPANQFDFRHEIEYGLTDRFQLGLYVADWKVVSNKNTAIYQDTALEGIYNLTNPVTDLIGSGLYGEVKLGDQKFELEGKLLLQKNFGPVVLAYNVGIEAEWEGDRFGYFNERSGEFMQSFGASYQITPAFFVGGEFLHEIGFAEWSEASDPLLYAGPNLSYRFWDHYFITTTTLFQVTQLSDEPNFQWRMIFGMHF